MQLADALRQLGDALSSFAIFVHPAQLGGAGGDFLFGATRAGAYRRKVATGRSPDRIGAHLIDLQNQDTIIAGKQQPQPPAKKEASEDVLVIYERVKAAADQTALRIQQHEKWVDEQTKKVEEGVRFFGKWMKIGLPVGLLVMLVVLFYSMSPIVRAVVDTAASKIDWDAKMKIAADEQLKQRLTADVLAKAIKDDDIQKAATAVADSPTFKADIRAAAESAARKAVTANVDKMIADTNSFRAIIEEQLRAERERMQAVMATTVPVTANNRDELVNKLIDTIMRYKELGSRSIAIEFYPVPDDVLHIITFVNWEPEESPKRRTIISQVRIDGLVATQRKDLRDRIAKYFDQSSVPTYIGVRRNTDPERKKFTAGLFGQDAQAMNENYDTMARILATDVVDLADECLELKFPTNWNVQSPR